MFDRIAAWFGFILGSWQAFFIAAAACILWAISGPIFHFSDTWQLVINTATTILTFLAVFLIQNEQNRQESAVQAKLDEILRAIPKADNSLRGIETPDE